MLRIKHKILILLLIITFFVLPNKIFAEQKEKISMATDKNIELKV